MIKRASRVATNDEDIEAAIVRGKAFDQHFTPAVAAEYRAMDDVIAIRLSNGVDILIPRTLLQGLDQAAPSGLNDISVVGNDSGLRWEQLDVDHYVPSLMQGAFGNRQWMSQIGKRGGATKNRRKSERGPGKWSQRWAPKEKGVVIR